MFGEIYFILGLSGRARVLNFFQVPSRFVGQLPDSYSMKSFYFGPTWAGTHTEFVSGAEKCVMLLLNSVFGEVYFIFGGASLARHIYKFLVPLVLLGVDCA